MCCLVNSGYGYWIGICVYWEYFCWILVWVGIVWWLGWVGIDSFVLCWYW